MKTKHKYKIGDRVEVKDIGNQYCIYEKVFIQAGFKNTKENRFVKEEQGIIFNIIPHEEGERDIMLAIRNEYRECLIGRRGVKLIESIIQYEIY